MKKVMNVVVSAIVFAMSFNICCNAAEVALTTEQVEEVEEVLYDTMAEFMSARSGLRDAKKYKIEGDYDRRARRLVYKYAELSNAYTLCDAAGVPYHEHANVREYGRIFTAYFLMDVESAQDLSSVDPKKMIGIFGGSGMDLAASRAGRKVFIESSSMQEGMKTIRAELVAKYGEAGLKKRLEDIINLQRSIADFVLKG